MISCFLELLIFFFPLINVLSLHNPKYNGCNYLLLKCATNVKAWGVRAPYKLATLLRTNQYNSSHFHVAVSNCDRSLLVLFFSLIACDILQQEWCSCSDAAQREFPHRAVGYEGQAQQFSKEAHGHDLLWVFPVPVLAADNLLPSFALTVMNQGPHFGSEFDAWIRESRSVITTNNKNEAYWIFKIISNSGRLRTSRFWVCFFYFHIKEVPKNMGLKPF